MFVIFLAVILCDQYIASYARKTKAASIECVSFGFEAGCSDPT
jgi:hypothetical protein